MHGNKKGSITFARLGKESRGTDLLVNLVDNPRLDTINFFEVKGFPSFGDVINGMDVVNALFSGYGGKLMDHSNTMYNNRSEFLKLFPQLDMIRKAYVMK